MGIALAVVPSVAIIVIGALQGLRMWLAHAARKFEHAPVAELARKLDELEHRLLAASMRR